MRPVAIHDEPGNPISVGRNEPVGIRIMYDKVPVGDRPRQPQSPERLVDRLAASCDESEGDLGIG